MSGKDFRFACRACGKCCNSPPQLSIREMYEHLDDFVLHASIITQPVVMPARLGKNRKIAQLVADRTLELGSIRYTPHNVFGDEPEVMTTLCASALPYPHKSRCTVLLEDGLCAIYDRRPNACRYLPGQHLLPLNRQDIAMKDFKELYGDDCDWSENAPIVVKDGRFIDPKTLIAFANAEIDDRMDAKLLALLLDKNYQFGNGDEALYFSDFVNQSITTVEVELPVVFFTYCMFALQEDGLLPSAYVVPEPREVARRQIAVCERLIAENIRSKDKAARPHTEVLRAIIKINREVLTLPTELSLAHCLR